MRWKRKTTPETVSPRHPRFKSSNERIPPNTIGNVSHGSGTERETDDEASRDDLHAVKPGRELPHYHADPATTHECVCNLHQHPQTCRKAIVIWPKRVFWRANTVGSWKRKERVGSIHGRWGRTYPYVASLLCSKHRASRSEILASPTHITVSAPPQ